MLIICHYNQGNSTPHIPSSLSPRAALAAGLLQSPSTSSYALNSAATDGDEGTTSARVAKTLVCHSSQIATQLPAILALVPPTREENGERGDAEIVVVGGGKSAQE